MDELRYGFRITSHAPRSYRGKRARRHAFYDRQRLCRLVRRLAAALGQGHVVEDAWRDAMIHGSAWYEMQPDGRMRRTEPILW